jgi:hypothetical protein
MMKRKTKRYDEGGVTKDELEIANASEDPIQELNRIKGFTDTEDSSSPAPKKQSFKEAFAEARKGGGKTFEWEGKKYTTDLASGNKPTPKAAKPAAPAPAKPVEKYETPYDRKNRQNREAGIDFDSMVGKLKNRITNAPNSGQDRILTGIKKKSDENKMMGNTGLKNGGKVSSASKRADGCAIRGKTRA